MDRKALQILLKTYWSAKGWRPENEQVTPMDDLLYAKRAGVMFDPVLLSHDRIVRRALDAAGRVEPRAVADAFLASLSTRRLDLRSALGSYAVLRHLPDHEHHHLRRRCPTCGEYDRPGQGKDLNVLNFERCKWGGVRHDEPLYAAFDLEQFERIERPGPVEADLAIFGDLLRAIEAMPGETTAPQLQAKLGKLLPSNKAEREALINIIGYAGILAVPDRAGYRDGFVPPALRELPAHRFVDVAYPACWWKGEYGIDRDAAREWFPALGD